MHKLIYILGIDALEYDLVNKLNLNNLKQIEYCKIVVPINEKTGVPSSPEVWASFLTGRMIHKTFEKSKISQISNNFIQYLIKRLKSLNIDLHKDLLIKCYIFYKKFIIYSPQRFGNLKQKTFLDIKKSKEVNVPFYSFDNKTLNILYLLGIGEISLEKTVEKIKLLYEYRKKQIMNEIDNIGNEDVIFAFMHTTDLLQHLLFRHIAEIEKHYIDLDYYVSILKRKLENSFGDIIFIIISDHGFDFDKETHSKYAFYSSNSNLIPKPENITDFHGIILDILKNNNTPKISI